MNTLSEAEIPAGLLYYTQSDSLIRVAPSRHELRGLMIARNNTAGYMVRRRAVKPSPCNYEEDAEAAAVEPSPIEDVNFLPPTIDEEFACKKCYAVDGCMLYRKVTYHSL